LRYVSRSANYTLIARNEQSYEIYEQIGGNLIPKVHSTPILLVEFRHGVVPPDEAYAAMMHWSGMPSTRTDPDRVDATGHSVPDVFGAVPYQRSIPIRDGLGRITGISEASRPDYSFSLFDSEWILDKDDRAVAEEALAENADNGIWYVKVEKAQIPAPWPGYDKARGTKAKPVEDSIVEMVVNGGFDPNIVCAYEKSHKNRPAVVAALETHIQAELAAEDEKQSLTVTVA
jgi:hypothetical protein